jgi:hypothetical protein
MGLGLLQARGLMRLSAVMFVIALPAMGIVACGDEDESAGSGGTAAQVETESPATAENRDAETRDQSAPAGPTLTGNTKQARAGLEAVDGVYGNFASAVDEGILAAKVAPREMLDAAKDNAALVSVCDLMSEKAKRQTVVYAQRSSGLAKVDWTCENATALLLRRASDAGSLKRTLRAKVIGVNAEGDRATASVRFGRTISSVSLIKEDGVWKLAASPSGSQ